VNFSKFLKGESFENLIENSCKISSLPHIFDNFSKKISGFFRKPLQRFSKNSKFEYAVSYLN
jgi:hypothetical protein